MAKLGELSFKLLLLFSVFPLATKVPTYPETDLESGSNGLEIRIEELKAMHKTSLRQ
jgi:hypothetical protein